MPSKARLDESLLPFQPRTLHNYVTSYCVVTTNPVPVCLPSGNSNSSYYLPTTQYTFQLDTSHVASFVPPTMAMVTTSTLLTLNYVRVTHPDFSQDVFTLFLGYLPNMKRNLSH